MATFHWERCCPFCHIPSNCVQRLKPRWLLLGTSTSSRRKKSLRRHLGTGRRNQWENIGQKRDEPQEGKLSSRSAFGDVQLLLKRWQYRRCPFSPVLSLDSPIKGSPNTWCS